MEKISPVAEALKAKTGERPKRRKLAVVGSAVAGVALIAGGITGVNAANAYRADIEAMQASAEEFYDAAAEQQVLAQDAADSAALSAVAASESVTSLEAAEAEAQAVADAEAAAEAARVAQSAQPAQADEPVSRTNLPSGATPPNVSGTDQPDSTACASSALQWDGSKSVCA